MCLHIHIQLCVEGGVGRERNDNMIITDSVCRDGTDMPYVAVQAEAWKTLLKQSCKALWVPDLHTRVFCNHEDRQSR